MKYIDDVVIANKKVLLRVDFNVSLLSNRKIADDQRIRQSLSTIKFLLQKKNRLILVSHFGQPKKRDTSLSLRPVAKRLQEYLPETKVILVSDFYSEPDVLKNQTENEILLLENIRFYEGEKKNDPVFAKQLALLADIYVNDAFGVSHRTDASIVGIPRFLPSYGGLLLKKEVETILRAIHDPKRPLVAILGGAKISTKIHLVSKLMNLADYVLLGGGLAINVFAAKGYEVGKSIVEEEAIQTTKKLLSENGKKEKKLILPSDAIVAQSGDTSISGTVKKMENIGKNDKILDIGPEAQAQFGQIISAARTIIWNGPVGYFENPAFQRGTDFIYYSIAHNPNAVSIVGGGDTLAAISKKEYLDTITHISTGGGAMLTFIEQGSLPGIDALNSHT
ncbi:MAG: phosphoglycerate kinase [Candidatus Levybacteria bacterium]|nr:phosphoglycerate kinase [Candidatus Levybacteria bacterium]